MWSKRSEFYKEGCVKTHWNANVVSGGITSATLVYFFKKDCNDERIRNKFIELQLVCMNYDGWATNDLHLLKREAARKDKTYNDLKSFLASVYVKV